MAKSLAAFLAAQMPSDASLRLVADAASPSQQARQTLSQLESLRTNKHYAPLRHSVDLAIDMVTSPQMTLRDASLFLSRLVTAVFADVRYLEIIRRPSLWTAA